MGLCLGHQNLKRLLLCRAPVGVPRCKIFVVYPAVKDYPSVLHMVIRRALACNFLQISFCVNEIENVEGIVGSSHFYPQNQNKKYVPTCIPEQRKDIRSFHKASVNKK